jgi:predicted DCC family thiol-disulfide oxidoreductase YuxK
VFRAPFYTTAMTQTNHRSRAFTQLGLSRVGVFGAAVAIHAFHAAHPSIALDVAWKVTMFSAFVGLLSRTSAAAACALGLFILQPFTVTHVLILAAMLASAILRTGDAWSIDSLVRAYRSRDPYGQRVAKPASGGARYAMLFDGGCGLCKGVASVAVHLDLFNRIEPMDVVHDWPRIAERFPFLSREKCLEDMHVVKPDGSVVTRFEAYRHLAWQMPATWLIVPLLYVPGVPQIGDRIYRYVAVHRHDRGCELPPP